MSLLKGETKIIGATISEIEGLAANIEAIKTRIEEKYDAMSERSQEGDKGTALNELKDNLENALTSLEEAKASLENID